MHDVFNAEIIYKSEALPHNWIEFSLITPLIWIKFIYSINFTQLTNVKTLYCMVFSIFNLDLRKVIYRRSLFLSLCGTHFYILSLKSARVSWNAIFTRSFNFAQLGTSTVKNLEQWCSPDDRTNEISKKTLRRYALRGISCFLLKKKQFVCATCYDFRKGFTEQSKCRAF